MGSDGITPDIVTVSDAVSIPRSEFCGFGRVWRRSGCRRRTSFNSSVGILWVRTGEGDRDGFLQLEVSIPRSEFCGFGPTGGLFLGERVEPFQFLGRNSVGSDTMGAGIQPGVGEVSIPRSEFCGFGPEAGAIELQQGQVSIPRSEFCGFGREDRRSIKLC